MSASSRSDNGAGRVAVLWDESFLWGVMAYTALQDAGLSFSLIRVHDLLQDGLAGFRAVLVPGGWASNKVKALGERGTGAIRRFVESGGTYIGFCGGAGLATLDGIGLVPVSRRPTRERVPSFSGRIRLAQAGGSLWEGIADPVFHAWWPSQFVADSRVKVLATYADALPDAFSSDVNVGDAEAAGAWPSLEQQYGINLDPARLRGEPAVIEGTCGSGRVVLSLVHFDTPGDENGRIVLRNLWRSVGAGTAGTELPGEARPARRAAPAVARKIDDLAREVQGLIDLGTRNFLWIPRDHFLLQWRRGVRGLEYCTLSVMVREIQKLYAQQGANSDLETAVGTVLEVARSFVEPARELLVKERFAMQRAPITYERCDDQQVNTLRDALFSRSKSHGGLFKELIDGLDAILYRLLTGEVRP